MVDRSSTPASGLDAFRDLERWLSGQAALGSGMSEALERESERQGREILRLALQAHIDARGDGDLGEAIDVADEHGRPVRLTHKRLHTRPLVTLFGEVRVTRMGYGARGREAIRSPRRAAVSPGPAVELRVSAPTDPRRGLQPVDEAIALTAEITGTTIPKRSAEQLVQDAAVDFDTFLRRTSRRAGRPGRR